MPSIWSCPVCGDELQLIERSLVCPSRHSFDLARSGYVNLLLVNQKGSKDPGDNAEMIRSRAEFLQQGHYQALSDTINEFVLDLQLSRCTLLDAGCGEGYFLRRLEAALCARLPAAAVACVGIDISKSAVQQAAKQGRVGHFAVASTFRLPVVTESVDVVLKAMAPGDLDEIQRVLRPGGYYVSVTPGPWHLHGLKQLIYQQTGANASDDPVLAGFELQLEQLVRRDLCLQTSSDIRNLLAMTPYYWNISAEARAKVTACERLDTPMEFLLRQYRKPATANEPTTA